MIFSAPLPLLLMLLAVSGSRASRRHLRSLDSFDSAVSLSCKVVTIGKYNVGKTSIIFRMQHPTGGLLPRETTVSPSLVTLARTAGEQRVTLNVWDTAGQERFSSLALMYVRGAHVVLAVFDFADKGSFAQARDWMETILRDIDPPPRFILVGNKSDIESSWLDDDVVREVAALYRASYLSVSAKTGDNIDRLIEEIVRLFQLHLKSLEFEKKASSLSIGPTNGPSRDSDSCCGS